jgi:hypothetical protein
MEIRLLTADDASEWWRLRWEALPGDPEAFSPSAEELQSPGLEAVKARLGSEREDHFVVGAFENGLLGWLGSIARRG